MNLKVIELENVEYWDSIVKSFINYDVYYLAGYVKAFYLNGDGTPKLIYISDETTKAMNVVMSRDIAEDQFFKKYLEKNKYFDYVTPYGYGGMLIEGDNVLGVKQEYEKYCINNNIISEFVRYSPFTQNYDHGKIIYENRELGKTVFIDCKSEEFIWNNLTGKNRNVIRKAISNGIEIVNTKDASIIDEFINIYYLTMDRDNANAYYYFKKNFFESIITDLNNNFIFFYAKYNDKIVSVAIFLFANNKMHYHLSASLKEYQNLAPSNLLIFEAAKYACKYGYKILHLGGGVGSQKDNLYKFKKAFSKSDDMDFVIGTKIFNSIIYDELTQIKKLKTNLNESYFPKYRG